MIPTHLLALLAGAVLDLLIGDPEWFYHPVRLMGKYISFAEHMARRGDPPSRVLRRRAVFVAASTVLLTGAVTGGVLWALKCWGPVPHFVGSALIAWMCLSARNLADEAEGVRRALEESVEAGRLRVARIVGRDTQHLSRDEIVRATLETVAENLSDGVISPMLWYALGGPVLAMAFKAASTLDSMIGYMDEKYRDVGWFAARADDGWNYVPARLTALIMCLCAFPLGLDGRGAIRIVRRDHRNHLSPNCAWPESAAAGALGVQLGGTHEYFGKRVVKPTIGDDLRPPEGEDIRRLNRLMFLSAGVMLALVLGAGLVLGQVF